MTKITTKPALDATRVRRVGVGFTLAVLTATAVAGCRPDHAGPQVAGWQLIDAAERHPILVSQQPVSMRVAVRRGSYGLSNSQRGRVAGFLHKFRAIDTGNSKLIISAPSSGANEVAAMQIVAEIRDMIAEASFAPSSVHVEANPGSHHVRLSYLRVVAQGPECGLWPSNIARDDENVGYANFGCAGQNNLAAMVANPADLLGPRTQTPRVGDRRDKHWRDYVKGEITGARKSADEKVNTEKSGG